MPLVRIWLIEGTISRAQKQEIVKYPAAELRGI